MEWLDKMLPYIVTIVGAILSGGGVGYLTIRSFKKKLEAEAKDINSTAEKTDMDAANVLKNIVLELIEPYREEQKRLSDKVDRLQKKIEEQQADLNRFAILNRKTNEELEQEREDHHKACKFIRELIERFHAIRNEFYEELGRWPVVGLPDGVEDYEE